MFKSFTVSRYTGFTRWMAMVLVFVLALGTVVAFPSKPVSAERSTKLTIHYKPAENNTKDWNLWIWPEGKEGQAYPFNGEDGFGQVATVELSGDHQKVGFIVRTDDWDKDVAEDRFIEGIVGGEAEIWLISGDPTIYTAPQDGSAEISPRIIGSSLDEINKISVEMNIPFKTGGFEDEALSSSPVSKRLQSRMLSCWIKTIRATREKRKFTSRRKRI
jgi:hypothetical protein